jgi:biotin operon repressor
MVEIVLPPGCADPFSEPAKPGSTKQEARVAEKTRGKPMQDVLLITALPDKGKRREVALACLNRFTPIAEIAEKLACSEGSVRSHLNDLHLKHGLGFEILEGKAKVLAPDGYADNDEKDPLA